MSVTSRRQIQVLHVDDEPEITELTGTFLQREDDRFTVETATSADEGLQLIDEHLPDCIVSDYNMPGMDGLEFLQTVREEYPDLPFILFTGRGSEAVASDAISAGVTDYLQKQSGTEQYELLANRIRNAVRARRETQRADRQERLMRLTEFVGNTGGFELDVETGEIIFTDGAHRILDLPDDPESRLESGLEEFHPEDRKKMRRVIDRTLRTGEQTTGEFRYQPSHTEERLFEITWTPGTATGETTTLRGAIHDITDRRERQQELQEYETIVESLTDAVYVLDEGGRFTYVNDEFVELVGPTFRTPL
jgi:CheY-like chemotaxis protein